MFKTVVFIDNGSSGSIGIISDTSPTPTYILTPIKSEQDYTKKKKNISRLDHVTFMRLLSGFDPASTIIFLERPLINSTMFNTSISASRVFESQLVIIEQLGFPHQIIDSKEWQTGLLPSSRKKGTTSAILKKESMDLGLRLFPMFSDLIKRHKDADGILGAYSLYTKMRGGTICHSS